MTFLSAPPRVCFQLATACLLILAVACPMPAQTPAPSPADPPAAEAEPATPAEPDELKEYIKPSIEELKQKVGEEVVVEFRLLATGGRTNVYLNSMENWRDEDCLAVQVVDDVAANLQMLGFDSPKSDLMGKIIRCTGKLELNRGRPTIRVTDVEEQLKVLEKPSAETEPETPEASPEEEPGLAEHRHTTSTSLYASASTSSASIAGATGR